MLVSGGLQEVDHPEGVTPVHSRHADHEVEGEVVVVPQPECQFPVLGRGHGHGEDAAFVDFRVGDDVFYFIC